MALQTSIHSKEHPIHPPTLEWEELELGDLLGSGSFASVYTVKTSQPAEESDDESLPHEKDDDHTVATTSSMAEEGREMVLKCIKNNKIDHEDSSALMAAYGLKVEADILKSLPSHPNIIRLMGRSSMEKGGDPFKQFIVLERVNGTLDELLKEWRIPISTNSPSVKMFWKRTVKKRQDQASRMNQIIIELASALKFLHEHGVLHRDVKPANVGLAMDGSVRLLDFGCARRYRPKNPARKLTRAVGTARYMAPEVSSDHYCGFPADVFSWAILSWEVLTLKKPFAGMANSKDELKRLVQLHKRRPPLYIIASPILRKLLQKSWDPLPNKRPDFAHILNELDAERKLFPKPKYDVRKKNSNKQQ